LPWPNLRDERAAKEEVVEINEESFASGPMIGKSTPGAEQRGSYGAIDGGKHPLDAFMGD
jgi:hypothetical protein